jgi:hypothetical protein
MTNPGRWTKISQALPSGTLCDFRYFIKIKIEALKGKIFNFNEITKITECTRVPVENIEKNLTTYTDL